MKQRIGKVFVSKQLVYSIMKGETESRIFDGCLVINCRESFEMDQMEYLLFCPKFDEVDLGCIPPVYAPRIWGDDGRVVAWEKLDL